MGANVSQSSRAGFNDWLGSHDLVARSYLSYMPRAAGEVYDLSFMSLCFHCQELGSFFRLRYDFILNTIVAVLYSPKVEITCLPWLGCTGRADEDGSVVGLGSGIIHITGLVRQYFVGLV